MNSQTDGTSSPFLDYLPVDDDDQLCSYDSIYMPTSNTNINGTLQHQEKPLCYSTGQPIMPEAGTAGLHSNALTETLKECNSAMNTPKKIPSKQPSLNCMFISSFFRTHSISDSYLVNWLIGSI